MEVESSNIQPAAATPSDPPKRPYNTPVLRVYGVVRELTQGPSGGLATERRGCVNLRLIVRARLT